MEAFDILPPAASEKTDSVTLTHGWSPTTSLLPPQVLAGDFLEAGATLVPASRHADVDRRRDSPPQR